MEYIPDGLTKAQWEAVKKKVRDPSLLALYHFVLNLGMAIYARKLKRRRETLQRSALENSKAEALKPGTRLAAGTSSR